MSSELSLTSPDECLMEMHRLQHCSSITVIKTFSKSAVALTNSSFRSLANLGLFKISFNTLIEKM